MNSEHIPSVMRSLYPESVTGLGLTFVAVLDEARRPSTLVALHGAIPVGYITWDPYSDGVVVLIWVEEALRRRGVATVLWRAAREFAAERDLLLPCHSPARTVEGAAWAESVGGDLPEPDGEPEPWDASAFWGGD